MTRAGILSFPERDGGDRQHHVGDGSATPTSREPPAPDPFRAAASAVERLAHTLRDCAREVEARGGQRVARGMLAHDTSAAAFALGCLIRAVDTMGDTRTKVADLLAMLEGCRLGYVRETWALRIMQMGAEMAAKEASNG